MGRHDRRPALADSAQRNAFTSAQVEAIHRNLRFLETVATAPIGLTTDLKSLRESVPADRAGEERDRQAFLDITGPGQDPRRKGLLAQRVTRETIELLTLMAPDGERVFPDGWAGRAEKVLQRVARRIGGDIRQETAKAISGIYVIVDPEHTDGRPPLQVAEAALTGGAAAIQLRDKNGDHGPLLEMARALRELCEKAGAVFILNDFAAIAVLAGADGLHIGQNDIPVQEARNVLHEHQIVGTSNALRQEALESESAGADYVAVGAIFETSTKQDTRPAGLETLSQTKGTVGVTVIAIGGINAANIERVAEAGADAACVATAVTMASDPEAATRHLASLFASG